MHSILADNDHQKTFLDPTKPLHAAPKALLTVAEGAHVLRPIGCQFPALEPPEGVPRALSMEQFPPLAYKRTGSIEARGIPLNQKVPTEAISAFLQPTEGALSQASTSDPKMRASTRRPALMHTSSTVRTNRRPTHYVAARSTQRGRFPLLPASSRCRVCYRTNDDCCICDRLSVSEKV